MNSRETLKIELTPEQQEQVRQLVTTKPPVMKLTPEQLEDRVAPAWYAKFDGIDGRSH